MIKGINLNTGNEVFLSEDSISSIEIVENGDTYQLVATTKNNTVIELDNKFKTIKSAEKFCSELKTTNNTGTVVIINIADNKRLSNKNINTKELNDTIAKLIEKIIKLNF